MIRHIVLLQIPSHIAQSDIDTMIGELEKVAFSVPGALAFSGGPKMTGSGLSQGFTHAITIDFTDLAARDTYVRGLDQDWIGIRLSEMTEGGLGGILAISVNVDDIHTPDKGSDKKPELRWI
ncbi:MAG: stress responsive protein [Thalassospira sp. Nap_22]|jgi:hypothetical protein|uniref:Dabb family protein n=1 Tax=Thalassospira TaxID=168934 RepID=UPI000798451A|nr:Dabb family protein [Thalassospira sp. A40-3]KXJ55071.1 MAG: stress responsive protein [Thalassospira sp. Nap_22]QPO11803.1 Dabb family protein [Thalassospira sp. A40-3]